jgi:S-phase kinase-associated protein 1
MAEAAEVDDEIGGLEDNEGDQITLVSSGDNPERFKIKRDFARQSKLVANILEGDSDATEIQVKQVDGQTLQLIVKYLKHHRGKEPAEIAKPIRSVKMEKIVEDTWDAEYINALPKRSLFQLILGANYMDCKSLLHLGCAKVATMIKGKSPEEIKQILGEEEEA